MVPYAHSMQLRPARVIVGAIAWIAIGLSALFLIRSERQLTSRKAALRQFDLQARETIDLTADLRAAQQSYVAAGQRVAYWVAKVATTGDAVRGSIDSLRRGATADPAKHALDDAAKSLAQFTETDKRALDYINAAQQLMAADVIFTEGTLAAADIGRYIEHARLADRQHFDAVEASAHKEQVAAGGVAGVLGLLIVALLIPIRAPETASEAGSEERPSVDADVPELELVEYARPVPVPVPAPRPVPEAVARVEETSDDLRLTFDTTQLEPPSFDSLPQTVPAGFLTAAAELATDFGRVRDMTDLHKLVARTATLIDASGMVVWMGSPNGSELRPLLTHGYTPHVVARLTPVSRSASNAAAAAYRSGAVQIVPTEPGTLGAIVAPILTPDGCIGALAAELRGGEASERIQALTAIVSSHLAAVLMASAEEPAAKRAATA
jgi:hypothetical protein